MAKENVKLFFEKVEQNQMLQEKLTNLLVEEQDFFRKEITKLGESSGYNFSKDDVLQVTNEAMQMIQDSGELDDASLEAVSGGIGLGTAFFFIGVGALTAVIGTGVGAHLIAKHL